MTTLQAKELTIGDTVISESDKELEISNISRGFSNGYLILDFTDGNWSSVHARQSITVKRSN